MINDNKAKDRVDAKNADYEKSSSARKIWRDCMAGTLRLRAEHASYLPKFPAEMDASYDVRWKAATFFNMAEKTRNVMVGLVFQGDVQLGEDVDEQIKQLAENIDNGGSHLNVFARDLFENSFDGCSAVLVDAPNVRGATIEDERVMGLRPYWVMYDADSIINWRYRINPVSKAKELALIVFREVSNEPAGQFADRSVTRYRSFALVDKTDAEIGGVRWQLWREEESSGGVKAEKELILESEDYLTQLTQIPVGIVGCLGDEPPLIDIAVKNIEHFQSYSDYKTLIHKTCVPLLAVKGLAVPEGEKIIISGDKMTELSAEGDMLWVEIEGKSISTIRDSLQDIREEIALMGLSLLADKTAKVDLTATEALLNSIGETAELRVMATGLKDCIELCLGFTAQYYGLKQDRGGSVTLGTAWNMAKDAFASDLTTLETRARIAGSLVGIMPQQWLIEFLGVKDEDRLQELLDMIRGEGEVVLDGVLLENPTDVQATADNEAAA